MANCTNCAAPLPAGSVNCAYCGSRNDIDLKEINYYTTHAADSDRLCPHCQISLKTIDLKLEGSFLIERCDECLGLFFDPGELEALLAAAVTNVFEVNRQQLDLLTNGRRDELPVSYVKCPVCATLMNRVNFGVKSGVVIDRCREHGIWLDAGEFRRLCEWMKAGGKLLDQERQQQQKNEQLRAGKNLPLLDGTEAAAGDYSFDLYSSTLKKQDPDLFDIISSAIRFFTR